VQLMLLRGSARRAGALARSIFRKGASFTAAMVFELASTNLVLELGIILIVLMGWQFMAAEFAGGIIMVVLIALIFRFTLTPWRGRSSGMSEAGVVAIVSFVCSIGNVPLAAVLWHPEGRAYRGGISFGGVVSFIFADLIVLPILDIYRKYYGWKMMLYILGTF